MLDTILQKHPDMTVMISTCDGRVLTSTLNQRRSCEESACILNFTDKAKVLIRKLLSEDLLYVRMRGRNGNEIVITFDSTLEIITIQQDAPGDTDRR